MVYIRSLSLLSLVSSKSLDGISDTEVGLSIAQGHDPNSEVARFVRQRTKRVDIYVSLPWGKKWNSDEFCRLAPPLHTQLRYRCSFATSCSRADLS